MKTLWWVTIPVVLGARMKRTQRYVVVAQDADTAKRMALAKCPLDLDGTMTVKVMPYEDTVVDAGLVGR